MDIYSSHIVIDDVGVPLISIGVITIFDLYK